LNHLFLFAFFYPDLDLHTRYNLALVPLIVLIELLLGADLAGNINTDKELQCTLSYPVAAVKMLMALPVAYSVPSIGRVRTVVGCGGCHQPHTECPGPHLLFMALRDRGLPAMYCAGRPQSGR
jgi:hypothetical protein